jgi:uncharacterized cofD-like protein
MEILNVVATGGGHGLHNLFRGLRTIPNIVIEGKVGPQDWGGSTKIFRELFERLFQISGETGDLTQALCGLAPDEYKELIDFLSRKFPAWVPIFGGHSLKNMIYVGLQLLSKDKYKASELMSLAVGARPHRVTAMADEPAHLHAYLTNGRILPFESAIDTLRDHPLFEEDKHGIEDVFLIPNVAISEHSRRAIVTAHTITIGPGSLWTSIIAVLSVRGVREAFRESSADIVVIANLVAGPEEGKGRDVEQLKASLEERIGRKIDRIVMNDAPFPKDVESSYKREGKVSLNGPLQNLKERHRWLIRAPLATVDDSGKLVHDPKILAQVFKTIFEESRVTPAQCDPAPDLAPSPDPALIAALQNVRTTHESDWEHDYSPRLIKQDEQFVDIHEVPKPVKVA